MCCQVVCHEIHYVSRGCHRSYGVDGVDGLDGVDYGVRSTEGGDCSRLRIPRLSTRSKMDEDQGMRRCRSRQLEGLHISRLHSCTCSAGQRQCASAEYNICEVQNNGMPSRLAGTHTEPNMRYVLQCTPEYWFFWIRGMETRHVSRIHSISSKLNYC